jgi:hypothetical protein
MFRSIAVAMVVCLATSAYGAVGDLTLKPYDPEESGGGWRVGLTSRDAPSVKTNSGTVNPQAQVFVMTGEDARGLIKVALDSAKPDDKVLDVLRFDTTGQGKFDGAPTTTIKWSAPEEGNFASSQFGPLPLKVQHDGKDVPTIARGQIYRQGKEIVSLTLVIGACREGECKFGQTVRAVRIVNSSGNLSMNTASKPDPRLQGRMTPGDMILIDAATAKQPLPSLMDGLGLIEAKATDDEGRSFDPAGQYGNPILVDGAWYDLKISDDGAKITASPTPGPMGKIKLNADRWQATFISADHILSVNAGKDAMDIPAGKYSFQYAWLRKGKAAVMLVDSRAMTAKAGQFEVVGGKTLENPFGSPITCSVQVSVETPIMAPVPMSGSLSGSLPSTGNAAAPRSFVFQPKIEDADGRWVRDIVVPLPAIPAPAAGTNAAADKGAAPVEPLKVGHFEVTDKDGKIVYSAALEFS